MIKHHYNSKIPHLFGARAITFGKHIFYTETNPPPWLVRHEMKHVEQYQKHGFMGFVFIYIKDYLKGRIRGLDHWSAYEQIPFEIEARKAEKEK